jgi:predicted XRE-type DNA-binding protein
MRIEKQRRLRKAGWTVGDATQFLALSKEEAALVEIRAALAAGLSQMRRAAGLTQVEVARRIGSSQSRVAKMEAGDPSVSLDLLVKSLAATGAGRRQIGRLVAS